MAGFNDYTDDELIDEMKSRGYVVIPKVIWEALIEDGKFDEWEEE